MKIVYAVHQFYPAYCSGTESVTYQLANMAQMAGHRVAIVTYQPDRNIQNPERMRDIWYKRRMYRKLSITEFYHQHLPLDMSYSVTNDETLTFAREYLKKENPDILHVTHLMRVAPFIQAAKELGIPCVVTLTDAMAICPRIVLRDRNNRICHGCEKGERCKKTCKELRDYPLRLEIVKELLSDAVLVAAPSKYLADVIGRELELNIKVFPHGIDFTRAKEKQQSHEPNKFVRLGWFGRLNEHKGLDVLLKAMRMVEAENLLLSIYGRGTKEYEDYLHSISGNDSRIIWNDWKSKDEIFDIYTMLDAVVVSSVCNESYSLVKNEAISCGVPVIVSNLGALPENVIHEKDGIVFDPFNPEELAQELSRIANDPSILKSMAEQVRKRTIPSIEQEYFRYQAVYLDAIGR